MIIGITGGTGSGKTTALKAIRDLDGLVLDCDAIYHKLLKTDNALLAAIEAAFPGCTEDGVLLRKKLGTIVFGDKEALAVLNRITHGAVKEEVLRQLETKPKLAAIDAIGLFESGLNELCDMTVAITAPQEMRIARLMKRDNISKEYALSRILAPPGDETFAQRCDHVLVNDTAETAFYKKCLAFFEQNCIMKEKQ